MKLSIIILNYNTPDLAYDCLESIQKHRPDFDYEIIVVDNSVKDMRVTDAGIKKIIPGPYQLLVAPNNGFGAGNNAGAKIAKGEYLFLLNPDTILTEDSISKMLSFLEQHEEIGALTCLLGPDAKTLQKYFFGKFQSLGGLTIRRYNYQKIDPTALEFFYTDIVTGAALMIKRKLFERVGGFDERFFMYLEDDDLCKRLVDQGFKNAVLCTTKIIHLEGKSIPENSKRKKIYYASQTLYWQKHNGTIPTLLMRVVRLPMRLIKANK